MTMMKKALLALAMVAMSSTAFAGTGAFAYPNANGVVVSGPILGWGIQICYYEDDVFDLNLPAEAQTVVPVWACDKVQGYGARAPIWYFFKHTSPVRIIGARWAYALKKDDHHHNHDHHDMVRDAVDATGANERGGAYMARGNYDSHTLGFEAIPMERFERD